MTNNWQVTPVDFRSHFIALILFVLFHCKAPNHANWWSITISYVHFNEYLVRLSEWIVRTSGHCDSFTLPCKCTRASFPIWIFFCLYFKPYTFWIMIVKCADAWFRSIYFTLVCSYQHTNIVHKANLNDHLMNKQTKKNIKCGKRIDKKCCLAQPNITI